MEVVELKSPSKRYYVRSDHDLYGFIINPDNYKKSERKFKLESTDSEAQDASANDVPKPVDHVVSFESDKQGQDLTVFLVLYHDESASNSPDKQYLYFSPIRMDENFKNEPEIVWWIYLILGLMLLVLIIVLSFFFFVWLFFKVPKGQAYVQTKPGTSKDRSKVTDSLGKSDSHVLETKHSNPMPDPLNTDYITKSKDE